MNRPSKFKQGSQERLKLLSITSQIKTGRLNLKKKEIKRTERLVSDFYVLVISITDVLPDFRPPGR